MIAMIIKIMCLKVVLVTVCNSPFHDSLPLCHMSYYGNDYSNKIDAIRSEIHISGNHSPCKSEG